MKNVVRSSWLFCFLCLHITCCIANTVRICIPREDHELCQEMQQANQGSVSCVEARDRAACIRRVSQGEADVVLLSPEEMYPAGKHHGLQPLLIEHHHNAPYRYLGVAVLPKTSTIQSLQDLRGKKSCHTAVGRTVGWNVPVGMLLSLGIMEPDCDGVIPTVSKFFSQSCAVGRWSYDPTVNAQLKRRYSNLCALCQNPAACSQENEPYSGYEGALKCLTDGRGDIAFTKTDALNEYFRKHPELKSDYELLCLNGSRRALDSEAPCIWSERPTSTYAFNPRVTEAEKNRFAEVLRRVFSRHAEDRPGWFNKLFVSSNKATDLVVPSSPRDTWEGYLGNYKASIEHPLQGCPEKSVKMCVVRGAESDKCKDLKQMAYSHRIRPELNCVEVDQKTDCFSTVQEKRADIVTLDGGDFYRGGRYFDLKPIAGERYKDSNLTYFAVAVVKKDSGIQSLSDLQGKRSCHTGIKRTAGWVVPIGRLAAEGLIQDSECDRIQGTSQFFSGSCVPGAKDPRYNNNTEAGEKLCSLCIGDENGENKCQRTTGERYVGYSGAFRCLAEGAGDVAFVNHHTVRQNTDGQSQAPWARDLLSSDFRLLCGRGGTADVDSYRDCNLAEVPTHYVATSVTTPDERQYASHVLAETSSRFGPSSKTFHMFGPDYNGLNNLLFKDGTTSLEPVPEGKTYRDVLGEGFVRLSEELDPQACTRNA